MSIADEIIANSKSNGNDSPWGKLDEYGIPTKFSPYLDYTVARIIIRNPSICIGPDDKIYILDSCDKGPIVEDGKTVVRLSNFDSPFAKGHRDALVFNRIKELLPRADMDSVLVGDRMIFDGKTKKLRDVMSKEETDQMYRDITSMLNDYSRERDYYEKQQ